MARIFNSNSPRTGLVVTKLEREISLGNVPDLEYVVKFGQNSNIGPASTLNFAGGVVIPENYDIVVRVDDVSDNNTQVGAMLELELIPDSMTV